MTPRHRSTWAWGWADRFPDRDARVGLGTMASAILGFDAQDPEEPAREDNARLPEPRVQPPERLGDIVTVAARERMLRAHGRNYRDLVRGFRGDFSAAPDLVAQPRDEADVLRLLAWCGEADVAVVPFGGGTTVTGGIEVSRNEANKATLALDLGHFDRVLEVDAASRSARIQAGARGPVLEEQLATHGLTLRFYPQSFEFSTLGGWIATRAAGHHATLHTHIDDHVAAVRMLTPRGIWQTQRFPQTGAGPDPLRWVLGSEGALGVIMEAWMRVAPRPKWKLSASLKFASFQQGALAARAIAQSGLHPANCRLLDGREAAFAQMGLDGDSVLVIGFESADHPVELAMARAVELAHDCGGEGGTIKHGRSDDADRWRDAFLEAPYLFGPLVSLGMVVDTFETACTWDRFESLHMAVVDAMQRALREVCGAGSVGARLTHVYPDGPAPYYTFIGSAKRGSEVEQWLALRQAAGDAIASSGGTITHHHGVGRLHLPWYRREVPDPFQRALGAVKRELDPDGVMNPGALGV